MSLTGESPTLPTTDVTDVTDTRRRYPMICAHCGYEMEVCQSISMDWGMNSGCGSCLSCKTFLHLEIFPDLDGDRMISVRFDEYLAQKQATNSLNQEALS